MGAPERAPLLHEVQVVRAPTLGVIAHEVVPARDAVLTPVPVARALERGEVRCDVSPGGRAAHQIEDGLGREARHRRAAHMLDRDHQWASRGQQSGALGLEQDGPRRVGRYQAYHAGAKTERSA